MWALKLVSILNKHRKLIIINTIVVTVVAAGISFLLPKTYGARATILPPESDASLSSLAGLSTGALAQAATSFALPLMATPSDIYASILKSESVYARVVDSLNLVEKLEADSKWGAVASIREMANVRVENEGIVVVNVEADDPELAADIANMMVRSLDHFKKEMRSQQGRDFSRFLEQRIAVVDSSLKEAADRLLRFQKEHGAIALDVQSEALIKNLAEQTATLTAAEIELEILKRQLSPDHPRVVSQRIRVEEMRQGLRKIEQGTETEDDSLLMALEIPLSEVPDLSFKLAILTRDVEIYETTYELLLKQYEMARLQERRDTPTISVLDWARPIRDPVWPNKRLIVITAFVLSLLIFSTFVVVREVAVDRSTPIGEFLESLKNVLRRDNRKPPANT